jgi:hypothetical protein
MPHVCCTCHVMCTCDACLCCVHVMCECERHAPRLPFLWAFLWAFLLARHSWISLTAIRRNVLLNRTILRHRTALHRTLQHHTPHRAHTTPHTLSPPTYVLARNPGYTASARSASVAERGSRGGLSSRKVTEGWDDPRVAPTTSTPVTSSSLGLSGLAGDGGDAVAGCGGSRSVGSSVGGGGGSGGPAGWVGRDGADGTTGTSTSTETDSDAESNAASNDAADGDSSAATRRGCSNTSLLGASSLLGAPVSFSSGSTASPRWVSVHSSFEGSPLAQLAPLDDRPEGDHDDGGSSSGARAPDEVLGGGARAPDHPAGLVAASVTGAGAAPMGTRRTSAISLSSAGVPASSDGAGGVDGGDNAGGCGGGAANGGQQQLKGHAEAPVGMLAEVDLAAEELALVAMG